MFVMDYFFVKLFFVFLLNVLLNAAPPETNDQFDASTNNADSKPNVTDKETTKSAINYNDTVFKDVQLVHVDNIRFQNNQNPQRKPIRFYKNHNKVAVEKHFFVRIYDALTGHLRLILMIPKIREVMYNIGTCLVNGALEILTHFLPTPLMPLVASTASMFIPFEPVITLRDKMPVTSYRRAMKTAVSSFLRTFDKYKSYDFDEDPYMAMRFNRRFLKHDTEEAKDKKDNS